LCFKLKEYKTLWVITSEATTSHSNKSNSFCCNRILLGFIWSHQSTCLVNIISIFIFGLLNHVKFWYWWREKIYLNETLKPKWCRSMTFSNINLSFIQESIDYSCVARQVSIRLLFRIFTLLSTPNLLLCQSYDIEKFINVKNTGHLWYYKPIIFQWNC